MKRPTKRKLALKARLLAHSSAIGKKDGMAALKNLDKPKHQLATLKLHARR